MMTQFLTFSPPNITQGIILGREVKEKNEKTAQF